MEEFNYNLLIVWMQGDQRENLEAKLPDGFKCLGEEKFNKNSIPGFTYQFSPKLTKKQIRDITDTLHDIYSPSWQFHAEEKTNPKTGNTISALLIEKA